MTRITLALLLTLISSSGALADRCRAVVNGSEIVVEEENFATFKDELGTREKLLSWPSRTWNKAWGTPPSCRSAVLYDYLATSVPEEEIDGYCLTATEDQGYFLIPGDRNYRGMCKQTICEKVDTTAQETVDLSKSIARSAVESAQEPDTIRAVAHKSGALILSGTATTLSANLSTAGTTMLTALSTPAALTAVGVSVLAVGGAVYMCSGAAEVSSDG